MEQKEKELFKKLCSFKSDDIDKSLLEFATPNVLGHLFFNRMSAVAYGTLKKHSLLGKVNREFRNSLEMAYTKNIEKNKSFLWCIQYVEEILSECDCKYAMLKGAYLCKSYPDGYRTSNDIDLLVHPKDVTKIANALLKADFKQGNIRNGKFEPATRKEVIESKMMRGETIPYIKEIKLPGMCFLEIDINFSLDYKLGDTELLEEMINNTTYEELNGFRVRTLRKDDFFVHLCNHLYKEATTLPWVKMMRDMTLYKYCDVYMLLNDEKKDYIDYLFNRAKVFSMDKICAFAVIQMSYLFNFNNIYALQLAEEILKEDPDFIHRIVDPKEKKTYIFCEKNITERFFSHSRCNLLKEVKM